jgi:hypothetical protein
LEQWSTQLSIFINHHTAPKFAMTSRFTTLARIALRSPALPTARAAPAPVQAIRSLHSSPALRAAQVNDNNEAKDPNEDRETAETAAGGVGAKGRTGGGKPLTSSSRYAPSKPKVDSFSVSGDGGAKGLSEEQQREVDEHNEAFDRKHDRGNTAADDKVDKKFWSQ